MDLLGAEAEAPHLCEDFVGRLGPLEGPAVLVMRFDVPKDGGAELRDAGVGATLLSASSVSRPKNRSTRFSHEEYVGVKWNSTRG